MKNTLIAGTSYLHSYQVPTDKTVPYVFKESDLFAAMPPVFATAFMVGLMEWACMEALRPHMEEGEISLGTNICVSHQAATPVGMQVQVEVVCTKVDGAKTAWQVTARDEKDLIGTGTHERFTMNAEKFAGILRKKSGEG
jgi:fluoroacetyl-CoA thioesterase